MAAHKDSVFETWWPLTRALDLVRAPVGVVAEHLTSELARYCPDEPFDSSWRQFENVDAVFRSVDELTNFPTVFFALPTHGEWTVLWNNSFLCDGYDSLCFNLTRLHGLDTLHWSSGDTDGPFQAGTVFSYRDARDLGAVTRRVYCCRDNSRWEFSERGTPLPEEPTAGYSKRIKRERLNEALMMQFLARLGAEPWRERFYALPGAPCFQLRRLNFPKTISTRRRADVVVGPRTPAA